MHGFFAELARLPGVLAVKLGGSRARGEQRADSDWDVGLYYRASVRALEPDALRALGQPGEVVEIGEWGAVMNGGAWLRVDGRRVDVLYRDLDAIELLARVGLGELGSVLRDAGDLARMCDRVRVLCA